MSRMCIFQKADALLGQIFSKLLNRGILLGPIFIGTFFCHEYGKNSPASQKSNSFFFFQIDKYRFYLGFYSVAKNTFFILARSRVGNSSGS